MFDSCNVIWKVATRKQRKMWMVTSCFYLSKVIWKISYLPPRSKQGRGELPVTCYLLPISLKVIWEGSKLPKKAKKSYMVFPYVCLSRSSGKFLICYKKSKKDVDGYVMVISLKLVEKCLSCFKDAKDERFGQTRKQRMEEGL